VAQVAQKRLRGDVLRFAPNPDSAKPTVNGRHPPPARADHPSKYAAGLSKPTLAHSDLAGWLLAKEICVEIDMARLPTAAEHVGQKLSDRLSRLVSPDGSQAIVSRALHLAQAEFPFLDGVRAGTAPEACFEGLDARVQEVGLVEAGNGLQAVLSALLELLVGFLGEDFTLSLVRDVWPDLPIRQPLPPAHSNGH
jgi:hypothetical protein